MKKKLAILMSISMLAGTLLTACNRPSSGDDGPAEGKTPLFVGVYDGAPGYEFAKQMEILYEAEHPDVDVLVKHKKGEYDDATLVSKIDSADEDIYFGSNNDLAGLAKNGSVLDLTELISEKIYDDNGDLTSTNPTKSIKDTLWDEWEPFCKVDVDNGLGERFYAIPNFMPLGGLSYDADLFEEKGYEVPETYDELIELMDQMVADRIIPVTVSAYAYIYTTAIAFWANYEGKNNFLLNSTFSGTDSNLGEINLQNAYKLMNQEGRKAYLQFYYDIVQTPDYTTSASLGTQGHIESQNAFVSSIYKESEGERIAMIIENSFWEREAYGTIKTMGDGNEEYGWGKRNFKYMIAPVNKVTERKTVYCTYPNSYCFISSKSDQIELACDFMQFAQSRQCLSLYTTYTGCLRPFDYTMKDEEYYASTPYTRSLVDLTRRDDVDFVTLGPANEVARAIATVDFENKWGTDVVNASGIARNSPIHAFYSDKMTVQEYFEGYAKNWTEKKHTDIYNRVFGD